jgi:phenylpropionate dioxygenase-like ring-hydroxylating dioxygenase large terminal subunit
MMTATLRIEELVENNRVHSAVYTDQALFAEEIERIYHRRWIFIGHAGEIPNPGDFCQRKIGLKPVIFVHGQDGAVRVLMNRCTHRGNAICHLERGNAKAFTCAYHGWRFRTDGDLAAVPYTDRYDDNFDKTTLGLRSPAKVASRRGFVFASLNPDDVSLEDYLGPHVLAELDDIADLSPEGELDLTAGAHRLRFAGNWKLQVENAIDGYHANFTHRSHFDRVHAHTGVDPSPLGSSSSPARIRDLGNGHCAWDSRSLNKSGTRSIPGMQATDDVINAFANALERRYGKERGEHLLDKNGSHLFIFPNFVFVGAHIRLINPVSVDETEVQLFPVLIKGAPPEFNTRRLRAHEMFYGPAGGGQADDLEVFERNQIGLGADVDPWSLLSRGEHLEEPEGNGVVASQITDELSNRAVWRRWKDDMNGVGKSAR